MEAGLKGGGSSQLLKGPQATPTKRLTAGRQGETDPPVTKIVRRSKDKRQRAKTRRFTLRKLSDPRPIPTDDKTGPQSPRKTRGNDRQHKREFKDPSQA